MSGPVMVERDLLVYSVWAVFGVAGLAFLMEGFARDAYMLSLIGIVLIVAGFVAHFIVNAVLGTGFKPGETAIGISVFGVFALTFIGGWASGGLSQSDYWSGLTLFAVLALGLPIYLSTRYGIRGAFSQFHGKPDGRVQPSNSEKVAE